MNSGLPAKFLSAEKYVEAWFKLNMYYITPDNQIRNIDPEKDYDAMYTPREVMFNTLYFDYQNDYRKEKQYVAQLNKENGTTHKLPKLSEKDLEKAFTNYAFKSRMNYRKDTRARLKHDEERARYGRDQLNRFIKATFYKGPEDPEFKLAQNVIKHWLWCIKRKLIYSPKDVVHHIMPIFYGKKQGSGKSTAIMRLISPLSEFTLNGKRLTDVSDPREAATFKDNYIIIVEELAGAQRADIEQLKTVITESRVSFRVMRTNYNETVPQNCMFIGTSNKPLQDMIKDSTGMRRFFEYTVKDKLDWDTINTIDYNAVWSYINENREGGYINNCLDELMNHQQKSTVEEPVDYVLIENDIKLDNPYYKAIETLEDIRSKADIIDTLKKSIQPIILVQAKPLLDAFMEELKKAGYTKFTKPGIGRKLKEVGIIKRRFSDGIYYFLPKDQTLVSANYVEGASVVEKLKVK